MPPTKKTAATAKDTAEQVDDHTVADDGDIAPTAEQVEAVPSAAADEPQAGLLAPLLTDDAQVHADNMADFAAKARDLVDGIRTDLATLVVQPLTDFERSVTDPDAGRYMAASQRIRMHVEDADRYLASLAAACSALVAEAHA